jgi:predicted TIM-barrel fold metal-dependent hydrolase
MVHEADGKTRRPGLGDAVQRLHEQDYDGIDAEILFPPFFATNFLRNITEDRVYIAMVQAYNSWLAEGFCSVAPDRLFGLGIVPYTGTDDAIAEMKRCKSLGLRGITLKRWPNGSGRYQPEDDRFFEALLAEDMRLMPHISIGDPLPTWRRDVCIIYPI